MILLDVNVLVYAYRRDTAHHGAASAWLQHQLDSAPEVLGVPDESLVGFLRLVTNHRVFTHPSTPDEAMEFLDVLLGHATVERVGSGPSHWRLLRGLVHDLGLRANDIPDAHLVGLALERGAALATFDRGFARFAGLHVIRPDDVSSSGP